MKRIILFTCIALFSLNNLSTLYAQERTVEEIENAVKSDGKYALQVDNSNYLKVSIITGAEYKTKSPDIQFDIVLVGSVVKELADDKELLPFIIQAEKAGVRIVVCEFAMKKLGVSKEDLPKSVYTTPNGFTYMFGLQESGYKTMAL